MCKLMAYLLLGVLSSSYSACWAVTIDDLQKEMLVDQKMNKRAQESINQLDESKMLVIQEVKMLKLKAQNLEQYNQYLTRLIDDQQIETDSFITQIKQVKETRQGIVPLMLSMLENLSSFIQLDAPFLLQERQERLLQLQTMINKADISEAEKYRRILDAYHIEADFGRKMGTYQGKLTVDGVARTVDYFYLGRIVFSALSLDRKKVWLWSRADKQWREIDSRYASKIEKAIHIAKKIDIPALLELPLLSEETL